MEDELLANFRQKELSKQIFAGVVAELKTEREQYVPEEDSPESNVFMRRYVDALFGGLVPETTARDISASAALFMFLTYGRQVEECEDTHCDALITAQTKFVKFAHYIAGGQHVGARDDHEILQSGIRGIKDSFENYGSYVGGTPEQYALFLSKVTHDALAQVHGECLGLDENLLVLNRKYAV